MTIMTFRSDVWITPPGNENTISVGLHSLSGFRGEKRSQCSSNTSNLLR